VSRHPSSSWPSALPEVWGALDAIRNAENSRAAVEFSTPSDKTHVPSPNLTNPKLPPNPNPNQRLATATATSSTTRSTTTRSSTATTRSSATTTACAAAAVAAALVLSFAPASFASSGSGSDDFDLPYAKPEVTTESTPRARALAVRLRASGSKLLTAFWCSHWQVTYQRGDEGDCPAPPAALPPQSALTHPIPSSPLHSFAQEQAFGKQAMKDLPLVECFPTGWHRVSVGLLAWPGGDAGGRHGAVARVLLAPCSLAPYTKQASQTPPRHSINPIGCAHGCSV